MKKIIRLLLIVVLFCSNGAAGEVFMTSLPIQIKGNKLLIEFRVFNNSEKDISIHTGYLQHAFIFYKSGKSCELILFTNSHSIACPIRNRGFQFVPNTETLKIVRLKSGQYTSGHYELEIDSDDESRQFAVHLKNKGPCKLVYSAKNRGTAADYWVGKIESSNLLELSEN